MKKVFFITITILLLAIHVCSAQELSTEFSVLNKEDFALESYIKDPSAEAVILFDKGESYFFDTEEGYDIRFTRTKRIKILNRSGIKFSEVSIPFYINGYGKTEKIKSIEAYTYNKENGRLIKKILDPSTVYEETINNHWKVKKFVFPDVKEGTIVEYKYILETPFHFNLPDWNFQDNIPTIYSQYTVKMIPFYEYIFIAQGITQFDYQNSSVDNIKRQFGNISKANGVSVGSGFEFNDMVHTYVMKDVPAFRDEAFITATSDYIMKIDFQLAKFNSPTGAKREILTTWDELNEEFLKNDHFGKYIKGSKKHAKKFLEENNLETISGNLEKAKAIIIKARNSFSWDGYYSKYTTKNPKEFTNQKIGNSAELNLFLLSLLTEAGIDAKPVILSTRNHGKINSDYPFAHFFNNVIVFINVDGTMFLTDGTQDYLAYDRVPLVCINERGLILGEEGPSWINLETNIKSTNNKLIVMSIDPEKLKTDVLATIQSTEFESYIYKNSFNNDTTQIIEHLLAKGFDDINNIKTFNFEENGKPYVITFKGESDIEKIGDKIVISPFLEFPIKENLLKQDKRSYPVDFIYSNTESFKSTINIPQGFAVTTVPENFNLDNELIEITYELTKNESTLDIHSLYSFKKAVYSPSEYARIKYYFNTIIKKFNEQIVLEEM